MNFQHMDSPDSPLALDHLYADGHRKFRRQGGWGAACMAHLFAAAAAFLLLFTGLYMFVLPDAGKRRGERMRAAA